ncbi:plasmid partitioning protein RepB [Methylobacterium isbiliense]|uniref:Nucleoid occlusion protein n=2 Tax=Methylobacterium TaxID=407 RepID=A0ABQ4SIH8_9HYPH|nr:plasmid partitioning protein RepB [Methylobacterium isbiliense]MDN3626152.1 plasmid partitioning protein RepB [Methylobacterium isbiliense]GJE02999.1 Nucleoid occlusion protein [Methylobacterium isbiliense]
MKGRDALREMVAGGKPRQEVASEQTPNRVVSGPVRAMNLGLQRLSEDAGEARALRAQLESGDRVVELDPNLLDGSFIADRISGAGDPDFEALKEGIAAHGQQVPILARPHPDAPGRYQVAYGHRRLRAASELGRTVKAIVRNLSDAELVIAQGKENNERRDLSFIERALFAAHLVERKFDRPTIMAALGVEKGELSRLITVATTISAEVILAVGPAPKIGRPRWMQLAELIGEPAGVRKVRATLASEEFKAADTDRRFEFLFAALQPKRIRSGNVTLLKLGTGRTVARLQHSPKGLRVSAEEPAFSAFLEARLPQLIREFEDGSRGNH